MTYSGVSRETHIFLTKSKKYFILTYKPKQEKKMIQPKITTENLVAVLGIVLIQGALLPSHLSGHFPPLSLPALVFLGLCCYMYKAVIDGDWVYILSNGIGLTLNGLMIIRILIGG